MASLTNFGEAFLLATMFSSPQSLDSDDLLLAYGGLFTADGVRKIGCYIGLMTSTASELEQGQEVSAIGYVRQPAIFNQATYDASTPNLVEAINTIQISFDPAQSNYGTIRSIGIFGGVELQLSALFYINLATPIDINTGDSFIIPPRAIRVNLFGDENNGIKPTALRLALDLALGISGISGTSVGGIRDAGERAEGGEIFSAQNSIRITLLREGQQTVTPGTSLSFLGNRIIDFTLGNYNTLQERNNSAITRITNDVVIDFTPPIGATVIEDAIYDRAFIFAISSEATQSDGESNSEFTITPLAVTPITNTAGTPTPVRWQANSIPRFNIGAITLTLD